MSTTTEKHYYKIKSYRGSGNNDNPNPDYLTGPDANGAVKHQNATAASLWYFMEPADGVGYHIYNALYNQNIGNNLNLSNTQTTWYQVLYENQKREGYFSICKDFALNGTRNCIDAQLNNSTGWYDPRESDWKGTAWLFEEASEEEIAKFNKVYALNEKINEAGLYPIGTAYGEYIATESWSEAINAARALTAVTLTDYNENEVITATNNLTEKIAGLTFNEPQRGDLVRIKSVRTDLNNYNYLGAANNTSYSETGKDLSKRAVYVQGKTGDNEAATIFLYTQDGKLLNLSTGYYLENNSSFLGYNGITGGTTVNYVKDQGHGRINNQFYITFKGDGNTTRCLYAQTKSKDGANYYFTDAAGDGLIGNSTAGYRFTIEAVESLPVKVTTAGYGTLYTPAALTIPEGVKAYAAVINEATGEADLTEVTGTVAAGTGLVLEGEGNYSFAVAAEEGTAPEANDLTGSVATTDYASDGSDIFILAMPGGKEAGFYLMNNDDRIIKGGKAFLRKSGAQANAYIFNFGGTTGIGSVEQQENGKDVIYDLSGRRVTKAQRGLYIVNGRKVLVK